MWLGRMKVAFIPVHRPHAFPPDDPIPADWAEEIRRRVFFDPVPAREGTIDSTKVDRSLRTFVTTVSSGRADLDAVVFPMRIIDRQDVPVTFLEDELEAELRGQGFAAAALVMLGGPGAGRAEAGGFWARFAMREGVGVWAMELMHVLTAFLDLYPFGGNMGTFDNMAGAQGTHPSSFTKAAVGWLDRSAIRRHSSQSGEVRYDLHLVGLPQPPPTGRVAAVQVGASAPFLMMEARRRVDAFDGRIAAEGVIVYRVQTSDPLGGAQSDTAPMVLLSVTATGQPSPLVVGQTFTSGNLRVKVEKELPGGFTISVDNSSKAIGLVVSYETERADPERPPGPNNPVLQTVEIDSMPGFLFTATGGPSFAATIKKARQANRKIEITYAQTGPASGKILRLRLSGLSSARASLARTTV